MNIIFFGPPQVGKGSYASRVAEKLGIVHISTGDMFRKMAADGDPMGIEAKEKYWGKGNLVPDDITTRLLLERIRKDDCKKGFIIDGFPRTIPQAEELDRNVEIGIVFNFTADDSLLIKRATSRRTCGNKSCNAIFSLLTLNPKKEGICDKCGSALYQREDERPEIFEERLNIYKKQTSPLVGYYEKKDMLVSMSGVGEIKDIVDEIIKVIYAAEQDS